MSNSNEGRKFLLSRRSFLIAGALGLGAVTTAGITLRQYIERVVNSWTARVPEVNAYNDLSDTVYDVAIIGSGPAGATLGKALVDQGWRTLILEAGASFQDPTPNIQPYLLEAVRNSGSIEYPISSTRIRAVGGTSLVWTGRSPRLHPLDFERNAYTPEDAEWLFRYEEIEPYYEMAERTLRIRGNDLSEYHAPRRGPLPLHNWFREGIDDVKAVMSPLDIVWDVSPTSTGLADHTVPIRTLTDILPFFTDSPNGTLVSGAVVKQILADEDGNVQGLEVHDYTGQVKTIRARKYVVACGAMDSAKLLLQSKSDEYPDGFGNTNDVVGRFFTDHFNITFRGQLEGVMPGAAQLARSHYFYETFKERGLGSIILVSFVHPSGRIEVGATLELYPDPDNRITLTNDLEDGFGSPGMDLAFSFTEKDEATIEAVYELLNEILQSVGATDIEETVVHQWAHHHYGTCRMGSDPDTSVVDGNLRVHTADNLYVLSSATFPVAGGSHPTLMIVALAHRLGAHLNEVLA